MVKTCRVKTIEQFARAIKESEKGDVIRLSNPFPLEVLDSDDVNWFETEPEELTTNETDVDVSGDTDVSDLGCNVRDRT